MSKRPATFLTSADDLAPAWATEPVGEAGEGEGGAAAPQLSARAQKKANKRARQADKAQALAAAAPPAPACALEPLPQRLPAAAAPAAAAPPKALGFRARSAAALCAAADSPARQAEALWAAFRATPLGAPLTPLEYGAVLGAGHIAAHGLPCAAGAPHAPLCDVVRAVLPQCGRLLGTRSAAAPRPRGAPALLILTHSAPRACELIKQLAPFNARVAKLFARHVGVAEAAAALAAGPPCVLAVGTPHRVGALLEGGHLTLRHCDAVLLDSAPDVKGMSVLTMFGVREEWWGLYWRYLHARVAVEGACRLALLH